MTATHLPPAIEKADSTYAAPGDHLRSDHRNLDAQSNHVGANTLAAARSRTEVQPANGGGNILPPAAATSKPITGSSGDHLRSSQVIADTPDAGAGADTLAADQGPTDPHVSCVGGNSLPPATMLATPKQDSPGGQLDRGQRHHVARNAVASVNPYPADGAAMPNLVPPGESVLQLAAATLDDIERTRIAMQNRLRAMRDDHGVSDQPEYARAELIYDALAGAEHQATLELQRAMRRHPLGPWVAQTVGIGEKQGARLLAAIDDPYWNHAADRPRRGPAELWAYCGFAPGQKRKKGQKSNWNAQAKMRAFLVAESCIKQMHSPYRADYDRARASWAERDTSDGHKHNHALRIVAKCVLRDLYLAAKEAA